MLNDPGLRKNLVRAVVVLLLISLLIAVPYIAKRMPQGEGEKKSGSKVIRYGTKRFSWNTGQGVDESTTQSQPNSNSKSNGQAE